LSDIQKKKYDALDTRDWTKSRIFTLNDLDD
jgi:hypothetical protein